MATVAEHAEKHEQTEAPAEVRALVTRFAEHAESYGAGGRGSYNETQIRREFIDPLFKALGWDIDNTAGHAEAYKDVIHEDAIRIGGATKAPDYCFRIGGVRKFFVEAKKPAIDIKVDASPAYQLRRYAWSAKLPLSILTDFEEIAVYDCRVKPAENDKASTARTLYLRYDELPERWHELASIFSRDAILRGAFDRYADSAKKKRGTAEVDDAFLAEIEDWRDMLARNIALRNENLSQRDLNFAVQRTIDRIVFLRICEDRGIERYGTLQALTNGERVYERLFERFRHADDRYNSGLFHFTREKGRADAPDDLTPSLEIDDKPLKDILRRLYYPECPYEFSVLPADILGHVYEQFLGKVIRLTPGHRAVVEEKPEVRKAGGVYYTPTYIVDYIVKQTVGALVDGKTPQEVGGLTTTFQPSKSKDSRPLAVLDPACGSGSFLLGAYQFLLDWYRDRYVESGPENHTTGKTPRLFQHGSGDFRLTTAERKRILLSHIHGVDIDPQAVEVTKLSLLLKVLEGESAERVDASRRLFHERALPDLANNIKCGNSLIAPDFYDDVQMSLFDDEQRLKINVFDWKQEFSEIMRTGGFDAVIGNPPYIRIQTLRATQPYAADYLARYRSAKAGGYDIYVVFAEKAINLLCNSGRSGLIIPHKFLNAQYGEGLRRLVTDGRHLSHLVYFGHQQVFKGATTYTCLFFCDAVPRDSIRYTEVFSLNDWRDDLGGCTESAVSASTLSANAWAFRPGTTGALCAKIEAAGPTLETIAEIFVGVQTSADKIYHLDVCSRSDGTITANDPARSRLFSLESGIAHPLVSGAHVKRYGLHDDEKVILFPYRADGRLLPETALRREYPLAYKYLFTHRRALEDREKRKFADNAWYRFGRNQNIGRQHQPKLCVPRLVDRLRCACDLTGDVVMDNVDVNGVVCRSGVTINLRYLAGLLNSRLLGWFFPNVSAPFRGGWYSANRQFLGRVPIRTDFASPKDATLRDGIVDAVEIELALFHDFRRAQTAHSKMAVQRQIAATDRKIDELVYGLYGLTDEEIKVVEEATQ
jgi:hypothetical protein